MLSLIHVWLSFFRRPLRTRVLPLPLSQAAQGAIADEGVRRQLEEYIAQCSELLGDAAGPSSSAPDQQQVHRERYLFEGQISSREPGPAAPAGGGLLGALPPALLQQVLQAAGGGGEGGGSGEGGGEGGGDGQPASEEVLEAIQQGAGACRERKKRPVS